jgi:hypothetical protein
MLTLKCLGFVPGFLSLVHQVEFEVDDFGVASSLRSLSRKRLSMSVKCKAASRKQWRIAESWDTRIPESV